MSDIKVSVIVPIYNVEKYLDDCLTSLEKQSLTDIEVIMINDGSTDGSLKIAQNYLTRNAYFHLISQENRGLSAARNVGLDNAHGEYVLFLDSDDFIADDALEKLYVQANSDDLDVLKFVSYTFDECSHNYSWEREDGYKFLGSYPEVYSGLDAMKLLIENDDYGSSCCMLICRRQLLTENALRFKEGIILEDHLFHFQLLSLSKRVAMVNIPYYYGRNRIGSITQTPDWVNKSRALCLSVETTDAFIEAHNEIKGYCSDWQITHLAEIMMQQWRAMSAPERRKSAIYRDKISHILKKYDSHNSNMRLFYEHPALYRFFNRPLHILQAVKRKATNYLSALKTSK